MGAARNVVSRARLRNGPEAHLGQNRIRLHGRKVQAPTLNLVTQRTVRVHGPVNGNRRGGCSSPWYRNARAPGVAV